MGITMSVAGTFDGNDFAEILELLARRGSTGRLQVRAISLNASIRLASGKAVGVELIVAGGRVTRRDTRSDLEEVCLQALRSARGTFEFHAGEDVTAGCESGIDLAEVLIAARQRMASWHAVEAVIPSLSAIPRLSPDLEVDSLTIDQDQWRVIAAIDGRRSVSALARRLELAPLRVCQILQRLVAGGAIAIGGSDGRRQAGAPLARVSIDPSSFAQAEDQANGSAEGQSGRETPSFRILRTGTGPSVSAAPAG